MRMHYVPRLLLRKFMDEGGLWELDLTTGVCEKRNVDNAGKERHLYTVALETGFLKAIDEDAAQILQAEVYDRDTISLSDHHRRRLAEWFATLVHRNPKKSTAAKEFMEQALADPNSVLDPEVDYAAEYVEKVKRELATDWSNAVAQIEGEPELADAVAATGAEELLRQGLMHDINEQLRSGQFKGVTSAKDIFCRTITPDRSRTWAGWIPEFHWEWLHTDHEFVIGDDPLSRWSTRLKHIEYGLSHPDCEITIPLSRRLCVRMRREGKDMSRIEGCDYQTTCMYNNRQLLAASKKLYGSSRQMQREHQRWKDIKLGGCRLPRGG